MAVDAYLNAPGSTDEFERLFDDIEELLLNFGDTGIATAAGIHSLFRLAPIMPGQYHGRSVALVKTLYYLHEHTQRIEKRVLASYQYDLMQYVMFSYIPLTVNLNPTFHECRRVMTECIISLTALSNIKPDIATFRTDYVEYKSKSREIRGLFDKTKNLFESFQVRLYLPKLASQVS